jgi:membrane-bound lytic murein transglycosylase B
MVAVGMRTLVLGLVVLAAACATSTEGDARHVHHLHHAERHTEKHETPSSPADEKFRAFLQDFRATATSEGISARAYDRATQGITRNPRVEELNAEQPEFITPIWIYLDNMVSDKRIGRGREMLAADATVLANIESRYGVPKEILVAIWGAESNYGQSMGTFNMFEALATLGYDGPRVEYARRELVAALKMMEQQRYTPTQMTASWAGAFGQTQFVPSSFLAHGVDGDGDGIIDLWHSPADALASTANLLADAGWQRGEGCASEVSLPQGFDYANADIQVEKSIDEWRALGVRNVGGGDLSPSQEKASVYVPAGARGPAFLVFGNFKVLLKYNNAASYALGVSLLAGRFAGAAPVAASWPRDEQPLARDDRVTFQTMLKALGDDPGIIDGVLGHGTRTALRAYQRARGLPADGFPTHALLERMMAEVATLKRN